MKSRLALLLLLLLPACAPALAQDESAATGMRADAETEAAEAKPAAAAAKPRPALMAPLARSSTLLGIGLAGERLVAVGQRGHILLSDDSGKAWTQVEVPANSMLNRVRFRDAQVGWAVGHDATIVGTTDGGRTWSLQHFDPQGKALYDIAVLEGALIALGAYGTYLVSTDEGATWQPQPSPIADLGQHLNAVTRLADGSLLIAGERGLLARSKDGGARWELLDSPYTGSFFGALPFGERGALVFGLRGNIYVSDDVAAARTVDPAQYDPFTRETVADVAAAAKLGWRALERPTTEGLFGGATDGERFLLVGVNGVAVRIEDGAATLLKPVAPETLNDVVRHAGRWFAVGRRGVQDLGTLGSD